MERMITRERAIVVASKLFADEVADGSDCRQEVGRVGLPCTACAQRNAQWNKRVDEVRAIMLEAFR